MIEGLKQISAYIFILGGRILYNFLYKNLPIPNEVTVKKVIGETVEKVVEGSLRVKSLKKHLENHKTPLEVWMSEDGSGTINKVQYDPTNNTLVGFILPKDKKNSMPIEMSFLRQLQLK